jgi:hypothetical protein
MQGFQIPFFNGQMKIALPADELFVRTSGQAASKTAEWKIKIKVGTSVAIFYIDGRQDPRNWRSRLNCGDRLRLTR